MSRINIDTKHARRLGIETSNAHASVRDRQDAIIQEARSLQSRMTDDLSAADAKRLSDKHDALMAEFDRLEENAAAEEDIAVRRAMMRPISGGDMTIRAGFDEGVEDDAEQAFALRSGETFESRTRHRMPNAKEIHGCSVGGYIRALVIGPKTDAEKRALAEGTGSAGGHTVPDILSARLIDRLRAASTAARAGAQLVPLYSDTNYVAKIATDPEPTWRVENDPIAEDDMTFDRVTLAPKFLGVIVRASRELLEDSLNIETALPNVLATALGAELDRAVLYGSGVAPEPRGVLNFTGLTTSPQPASNVVLDDLINARTALRTANSDATAFIMSPAAEGWLATAKYGDGYYIGKGPLAETPWLTTTKVPTVGSPGMLSILAGDWRRLLIGIRSEIRVEVLKERYADRHQYGFVCWLRADCAAEHEAAFTQLSYSAS